MADKKICDDCGKDITDIKQYSAEIYDTEKKSDIKNIDICKNCMLKLKKHFPKKK